MTSIALTLLIAQATPKPISIPDIKGVPVAIPSKGAPATALIFLGTECPIANRMAPEMARLAKKYSAKGIQFVFVYPEPDSTISGVAKHFKDYKLVGRAVIDKRHDVVKLAGATVTPEAAVFTPSKGLVYRGRINNLYTDHNQPLERPTKNELADALDQILSGKEVTVRWIGAIGCAIPPLD